MNISNSNICIQNGMPRLYWLGQNKLLGLGLLSAIIARADGREAGTRAGKSPFFSHRTTKSPLKQVPVGH